jgi:phosphatidylglycerol lysyltransferase
MEEIESKTGIHRYFHWEEWGVRLAALLTLTMGIINLTSAITPALSSRLQLIETVFPLSIRHGSRVTSVLAGFALILVASALWRRKKTAWFLTVGLLVVTITAHLIKGLDFEEASLGLGLLILLIVLRPSFHAATDRPSIRQGLLVLAAAILFTMIYSASGFYFLDKHFKVHYDLLSAFQQTIAMFTSFPNPNIEPLTRFAKYFADSIYTIAIGTLGFALLMLIRPVLVRLPATEEERKRAGAIVDRFGRTALARATLFPDKSYFFDPENTVTSFAASGRGAIVLGDPIGPETEIPEAILAFKKLCTKNDWIPAYASVLPDHLDSYRAAGLDVICIGYEAIVDLHQFTLEGSQNKGLRYEVNHMEKLGFHAEVHMPPLSDDLMWQLREISDAWLTMRHGGEMHFSNGWFDEDYIRNGLAIVVHAPDGTPTAFANLVPEYQKNELTIDLMRRYRQVEHGTMEYLFARMLQWSKDQGYDTFSLGLSAIVGVGEKPEDPRVEQALHTISEYIGQFYNFKGLHEFKEKFHPNWEPRYLAYPGAASLPPILTTLLRVHSGKISFGSF